MTLELADRSITHPKGVAEDVFIKVGKFHFPTDFVVVDFDADPRVPLILERSFLRTGRALIDVYEGELILRDGDEQLIFHVDSTSKLPQKHANESINMINFIDVTCKDNFEEVLRLKKSNHPSSGSTTLLSDSRPSLTSFETSDSLLEDFADELAPLDLFPPGNEDVDFEADLREIELLLNHDPSTDFSPKITIDPNPKRFINEPALVCLPPPGDDDDDKENTIPLNELIPPSFAITSVLPTIEPEDSLIMGDEHLSTFPKKEMDEFIKSSVEEIVPIPSESEEDVQEENFQVYSNPLFAYDDEYISSDVNPLFDEVLEDIESKDSYVSNLDEPALLVTPLSDANEDECFDPGGVIDEIDAFLDMDIYTDIENNDHDSEGDIIYLESLLIDDTIPNLPPEVFLDQDPISLKDEFDNDDLMTKDKVFNLRIWEIFFSPTYVKLSFEDRHYLSFTYVIRIFLSYFTYPMDSFLPLSSGSEDTIFDPGISAFHFSSLEPVAFESQMEVCSSTCSIPMDN
ncbi:retrovirus-related pol polyprotein from transposon TNT 1-94 [Tanacetum coccineum]